MGFTSIGDGTFTSSTSGTTIISANTTKGSWFGFIDLSNMIDLTSSNPATQIRIQVTKQQVSGGSGVIFYDNTFTGSQNNPNVPFAFFSAYSCTIKITQLDTGAAISISWGFGAEAGSWTKYTSTVSSPYTLTATPTTLLSSPPISQAGAIVASFDATNVIQGDSMNVVVRDTALSSGGTDTDLLNLEAPTISAPALDFDWFSLGNGWDILLAGSSAVSIPFEIWYQAA